jgi:hypothetical protein
MSAYDRAMPPGVRKWGPFVAVGYAATVAGLAVAAALLTAAQERGEIATRGKPKCADSAHLPATLAELGIQSQLAPTLISHFAASSANSVAAAECSTAAPLVARRRRAAMTPPLLVSHFAASSARVVTAESSAVSRLQPVPHTVASTRPRCRIGTKTGPKRDQSLRRRSSLGPRESPALQRLVE